jgi:hypothetical protein
MAVGQSDARLSADEQRACHDVLVDDFTVQSGGSAVQSVGGSVFCPMILPGLSKDLQVSKVC